MVPGSWYLVLGSWLFLLVVVLGTFWWYLVLGCLLFLFVLSVHLWFLMVLCVSWWLCAVIGGS